MIQLRRLIHQVRCGAFSGRCLSGLAGNLPSTRPRISDQFQFVSSRGRERAVGLGCGRDG
jgi:hypothetical protein